MKKALELLQKNRYATPKEIMEYTGATTETAAKILRSKLVFKKLIPRQSREKFPEGTQKFYELIHYLTNTIEPTKVISKKVGMNQAALHRICITRKLRGPLMLNMGIMIHGINPETLKLKYEPLPPKEQQRIMEENAHLINNLIDSMQVPSLKQGYKNFLIEQLQIGIQKYAPEYCSPSQFIRLIAKSASRRYIKKNVRERFLKNLLDMRAKNNLTLEEKNAIFEREYQALENFTKKRFGSDYDEVFSQTLHALVLCFDRYDPQKHGPPEKFMQGVALAAGKEIQRQRKNEGYAMRELRASKTSENPHLQNRPKNNGNYGHNE